MFDMCSRNEESVVSKCVEGRAVGKQACGGPPTSLYMTHLWHCLLPVIRIAYLVYPLRKKRVIV